MSELLHALVGSSSLLLAAVHHGGTSLVAAVADPVGDVLRVRGDVS